MELSPQYVRDRLKELAKKDRKRKVFGASSHDYRLNPPIDVNVVESFEAGHGVTLPEDYKRFITEIGNGGAGPFYGLFPFGHDDDGSWRIGILVGDVGKPFPHAESWNHDDSLWEREPDIYEGITEEEEDRLNEEWDTLLEAEYWNPNVVSGAIPICHLGCALRQWLVVNGEQRGYVWTDYRADQAGLFPLKNSKDQPMSFTDWYLAWIEEPEMKMPTA